MNTPRTAAVLAEIYDTRGELSEKTAPEILVNELRQLETELAEVKAQISDMTAALAACHEVLNSLKDDEDWPVKPALQFEVEVAFKLAQIELYGK